MAQVNRFNRQDTRPFKAGEKPKIKRSRSTREGFHTDFDRLNCADLLRKPGIIVPELVHSKFIVTLSFQGLIVKNCKFCFAFTALAAFLLTGCEADTIGEVVPAAGNVTLDGKPIAGVSISLVPQEGVKGRGGYGTTGEDGSFTLQADIDVMGVPAGNYRVMLQKYTMPDGSPIPPDTSGADAGIVNQLPPVYSDPEQSQVYVTFPTPDGQPVKIDLKSRPR
ncbi:MAG TPA: hypothetical protein DDZ51_03145 [Planctomycetaceae bacterium]|nr:hypothetical protein [Planctomycetaceae bacterium]